MKLEIRLVRGLQEYAHSRPIS